MFIKLVRIGQDAILGTTPGDNPKQVLQFSVASDVGYGQHKKVQWIVCSLWGAKGVQMEPYFVKGTQLHIVLDDLHLDQYQGRNGPVTALKGRVIDFDFAGERPNQGEGGYQSQRNPSYEKPQKKQQQSEGYQHPSQQAASQQKPASVPDTFSDFSDDIPF